MTRDIHYALYMHHQFAEWGMSSWWSLPGLLYWHQLIKSLTYSVSLCNVCGAQQVITWPPRPAPGNCFAGVGCPGDAGMERGDSTSIWVAHWRGNSASIWVAHWRGNTQELVGMLLVYKTVLNSTDLLGVSNWPVRYYVLSLGLIAPRKACSSSHYVTIEIIFCSIQSSWYYITWIDCSVLCTFPPDCFTLRPYWVENYSPVAWSLHNHPPKFPWWIVVVLFSTFISAIP